MGRNTNRGKVHFPDEITPNRDWNLDRWIEAVHATRRLVLDENARLGLDETWSENKLYTWNKNGIPTRNPHALNMLTVLQSLAERNRTRVFARENIKEHAKIFLASKACSQKFAELDDDEIWRVCRSSETSSCALKETDAGLNRLYSRVHPRPPTKLFGRNADLDRVVEALTRKDIPVVVIDGLPGVGKTALAWYVAKKTTEEMGTFTVFDWTTDKRYIIDANGNPITTGVPPLDFEGILRSMTVQFGWWDLAGASGMRLENACADKLHAGRYLIVVDNLETIQDSNTVIDGLSALLQRRRSREPLASRALVTSRVQIVADACRSIRITGIDPGEWIPYVRYVEEMSFGHEGALTDAQIQKLGEVTAGNPLLMRIAISRYSLFPVSANLAQRSAGFDEIIQNILNAAGDVSVAFASLFDPILDQLGDAAVWLAQAVASREFVDHNSLKKVWRLAYENAYGLQNQDQMDRMNAIFSEALADLIHYRVLEQNSDGTYVMHSLFRSYLIHRASDDLVKA